MFLALGRTYVDFNDVRTNVDVGVALTSQITCVGRTKLAASYNILVDILINDLSMS